MITLESLDLQTITTQKIGELLIEAKKAYYTGGKPIMDDHTYDTLEDILLHKAPHHRLFTKVGHPNFDTGFDKKSHIMPMGSQNKVTNIKDLIHYFELQLKHNSSNVSTSADYVVQPKCDGISLEIIYKNGQLEQAITRGDGLVGDLITQNVVKMKNFIPGLPRDLSCSVRCEIMVTKKDFEKLNETIKKSALPALSREGGTAAAGPEGFYSNPRNAASGLSQRLDGKYSEYCSLYAVDIYSPSRDVINHVSTNPLSTEIDKIDLLKSLGFTPVESHICQNFDEIEIIYQQFLSKKRLDCPFEIDGLVIKINNLKLQKDLGFKNNRPKGQVAYKFPASSNTTQIKSVVWQVGPLGTITPVAEVDPIELSGAVVTFASLANYDLIKAKDLNIGDIVKISRRGDVIPHIENIVTKVTSGHLLAPTHCPSCKTMLIVEDKFLRCPNSHNCLSQILGSLRLFCDTLGILGLSDKTIAKLYQANRIRLPGDFFILTPVDIKDLDNLGEKSATNIIYQIQSKKTLTLKQIFDAAIIPNFSSQRISQLITAGYDTPDKLINITINQLEALPGFQSTLSKKVYDGIKLRRPWIESILNHVSIHYSYIINHKSDTSGLAFCITGNLNRPRKEIIDLIENSGGKVQSTVTSKTNYLICNSPSSSDKYLSAKKLAIKIITEAEFSALI